MTKYRSTISVVLWMKSGPAPSAPSVYFSIGVMFCLFFLLLLLSFCIVFLFFLSFLRSGFLLKLLICTNRHWGRKLKHKVWGLSRRLENEGTPTDSCLRIGWVEMERRRREASATRARRDTDVPGRATLIWLGVLDARSRSEWLEPCAGSSFTLTF